MSGLLRFAWIEPAAAALSDTSASRRQVLDAGVEIVPGRAVQLISVEYESDANAVAIVSDKYNSIRAVFLKEAATALRSERAGGTLWSIICGFMYLEAYEFRVLCVECVKKKQDLCDYAAATKCGAAATAYAHGASPPEVVLLVRRARFIGGEESNPLGEFLPIMQLGHIRAALSAATPGWLFRQFSKRQRLGDDHGKDEAAAPSVPLIIVPQPHHKDEMQEVIASWTGAMHDAIDSPASSSPGSSPPFPPAASPERMWDECHDGDPGDLCVESPRPSIPIQFATQSGGSVDEHQDNAEEKEEECCSQKGFGGGAQTMPSCAVEEEEEDSDFEPLPPPKRRFNFSDASLLAKRWTSRDAR